MITKEKIAKWKKQVEDIRQELLESDVSPHLFLFHTNGLILKLSFLEESLKEPKPRPELHLISTDLQA